MPQKPTNKSRTCPTCGVVVLTTHVCRASALTAAIDPASLMVSPEVPRVTRPQRPCGQCDHGWITLTRPDGSDYVAKCPRCPSWVRSNRAGGGGYRRR